MGRRVVITGIGTVNPLGNNVEQFSTNLFSNISSIKKNKRNYFISEVENFNIKESIANKKMRKLLNRGEAFAIVAAQQAVEDSGILESRDFEDEQWGLFLGCTKEFAPFDRISDSLEMSIDTNGNILSSKFGLVAPDLIQPLLILESIPNACLEYISEIFSIKGDNTQFMTNGVASTQAIGTAYNSIKQGKSVVALCGGFDSLIDDLSIATFDSLNLLACNSNEYKGPFDVDREGFAMGEGSGMLLLEEYNHAKRRGAKIYAEILGYKSNTEATALLKLEETGASLSRCIMDLLEEFALTLSEISFVNAYASGTKLGDKSELNAIKKNLGCNRVLLSCIKGNLGHLIGASGVVETIAAVLSLNKGEIPGNINTKNTEVSHSNIIISETNERIEVEKAVLKISRGIGGENAVLLIKKEV